jgi:hypothetical protein
MAVARRPARAVQTTSAAPIPRAGKQSKKRSAHDALGAEPPPDLDAREARQSATRKTVGKAATRQVTDATAALPDAAPTDPS